VPATAAAAGEVKCVARAHALEDTVRSKRSLGWFTHRGTSTSARAFARGLARAPSWPAPRAEASRRTAGVGKGDQRTDLGARERCRRTSLRRWKGMMRRVTLAADCGFTLTTLSLPAHHGGRRSPQVATGAAGSHLGQPAADRRAHPFKGRGAADTASDSGIAHRTGAPPGGL
jgi:hypothetical protein